MSEIIIIGGFNDQPVEVLLERRDPVQVVSEIGQGIPGLSAYQVAVKNGYTGTEPEWLDSLSGFSAVKAAGYDGTEEQWLALIETTAPSAEAALTHRNESQQAATEAEQSAQEAGQAAAAAETSESAAQQHMQEAQVRANQAEAAATLAGTRQQAAEQAAAEAAASEAATTQSALQAGQDAEAAEQSRLGAEAAEQQAAQHKDAAQAAEAAAEQHRDNAAQAAGESAGFAQVAGQARNAAQAAEQLAAGHAQQTAQDVATAAAHAQQTGLDSAAAVDARSGSEAAEQLALQHRDAAQAARNEAVQAAGSVSGVVSDLGGIDLSGGEYPAKPTNSAFWKVVVGGTVSGVEFGVGDTLMYSLTLDVFYKIDNTESVSSVNGKKGAVSLEAVDVGAEPTVAPGSAGEYLRGDKTWSNLASAVRAANLGGYSAGTNVPVSETDTVLSAIGKLQTQVNSRVQNGDSRLSDAREWDADVVPQLEAETGAATTARKWTAQRVFQAAAAWWNASAAKAKLDGIQAGAQVNVPTNLSVSGTGSTRTIASSTGTNANITFTAADVGALPLTGGTMTGELVYQNISTGGWARGLSARIQSSGAIAGGIGFLGSGDSVSTAYLAVGASPWASGNGVRVTAGGVTISGATTFDTLITGSVNGNAATATTLQTARTIGGVSFNGSANINLPGVNIAGNQNTTGNAATATALQTARTINGVSFNGTANITVADATKLPLAGGTMTGHVVFSGSNSVYLNASGTGVRLWHNGTHHYSDNYTGNWIFRSGTTTRFTFTAAGVFTATNDVTITSDERLKKDWSAMPPDFVYRLAQVKAGTYSRTDIESRQVGVSAQALQAVVPEAVSEADDEQKTLSVAYGNAALVAAVELARRVVELERRLATLEGA